MNINTTAKLSLYGSKMPHHSPATRGSGPDDIYDEFDNGRANTGPDAVVDEFDNSRRYDSGSSYDSYSGGSDYIGGHFIG